MHPNPNVVYEYLDHFCRGNIDGVESTLADEFRLRGPLFEFDSRDAYIQSLRDSPLEKASYRVLEISQGDDTVSVFYEYRKPSGSNVVAQFFRIRRNKIVDTLLVFDRGAVA